VNPRVASPRPVIVATVAVVTGASFSTLSSTLTERASISSTRFTLPTSTPWNSTGASAISPETRSRVRISNVV
jgi:hypothetical protein